MDLIVEMKSSFRAAGRCSVSPQSVDTCDKLHGNKMMHLECVQAGVKKNTANKKQKNGHEKWKKYHKKQPPPPHKQKKNPLKMKGITH